MKELVEKTFDSLFNFEELRQIWRETAPLHKLTEEQSKKANDLLLKIKSNVEFLLASLNEKTTDC